MEVFCQFGEVPPFFWPGQRRGKHTLPHAGEKAIQRGRVITHNAYIITRFA